MPRPKCIVEYCKEKQSAPNPFQMCFHHGEWLKFLQWLSSVQVSPEAKIVKGLWTPNSGEPSGAIQAG